VKKTTSKDNTYAKTVVTKHITVKDDLSKTVVHKKKEVKALIETPSKSISSMKSKVVTSSVTRVS